MPHDRRAFNLKSLLAALIAVCLGLLLVIVSENIVRERHPIIYAVAASLAATLLTIGLLGLAYEFLLRKELLTEFDRSIDSVFNEIHNAVKNMDGRMRLSDGISIVGLHDIGPRESHFDYTSMIVHSKKLYFVFNDGRTWFSNHHDDLYVRAQNKKAETHVILVHPSSPFTTALAEKVEQTAEELRSKIAETVKMIARIPWGEHKITVYGHKMPTSYSLIMNEEVAVFIPYPIARKTDKIPCFVFKADQKESFYHTLMRDVSALTSSHDTSIVHPPQLFT